MKYAYDESHSIGHSMKVLQNAHLIYINEKNNFPIIKHQEDIIYTAAALHDMCDRKYIDVNTGIERINNVLNKDLADKKEIIIDIINTMSYSKVKQYGYPNLGNFQIAYHIVREADLLEAYDFDRSMIYHMHKTNGNFEESYLNALELFENRVWKHFDDNLFVTDYSKSRAKKLHNVSKRQVENWKQIVNIM
tara:strand:- start:411 stop:986 length:576 start_codon:yes stop_codon:yes gene_type:complete